MATNNSRIWLTDHVFENLLKGHLHVNKAKRYDIENIEKALNILGLSHNPFGEEKVENQELFFNDSNGILRFRSPAISTFPPLLTIEQTSPQTPVFVYGSSGTGKTTIAFQLTYMALENRRGRLGFPVYFSSDTFQNIFDIAHVIAKTIAVYLVYIPQVFLDLKPNKRQSIVRLWVKFINEGDALFTQLREMGLPENGPGAEMTEEIKRLMKGITKHPALLKQECLDLLGQCIPNQNGSMQVFIDFQGTTSTSFNNKIDKLAELAKSFSLHNIFIVALFPSSIKESNKTKYAFLHYEELNWHGHLKNLLRIRLNEVGEDSISSFFDPEVKSTIRNTDDKLINASDGTPAGLIKIGNKILSEIGIKGSKLSKLDFDKLLGNQDQE